MKILNNEKGLALITVLLFGMVAFGVATGAYFMVLSNTRMSGIEKRYTSELNVSKGISEYVMGRLVQASLLCNGGTPCDEDDDPTSCAPESTIDISSTICTALGKTVIANGCADLTACYMSHTAINEIDPVTSETNLIELISINVNSVNPNSGEQADIDFVLRVE